jgi:hypothetical protein
MTKFSVRARQDADQVGSSARRTALPSSGPSATGQPEGGSCELYAPGHQMHYRHQAVAVRSPSLPAREIVVDDTVLVVTLEDGRELEWHHHDPERLRRVLESVPGKRVVYPSFHALRVGPYWFNCARESDDWQDCRAQARSRA